MTIEAAGDGGRHELLDYFRFCDTEFNEFDGYEFDFSAHTYYLDRNEWALHTFEEPPGGREHAMAMTPENVETTYLRAKNAASEGGYVKAAGEFRVQRQRHARRKHLAIARDRSLDAGVRARNFARAAENYFLDLTCGYGMRLGRIMAGLEVYLSVVLGGLVLYALIKRSEL